MSGFINNAIDFCEGFESVLPVGKVTKFIVSKAFNIYVDGWFQSPYSDPSLAQFKGMRVSIDRDGYNQVMNRRECQCE